jgi:putative NADPH-quinone reductase
MRWEPPHVVHDANAIDAVRLAGHVAQLKERLAPWREPETAGVPATRP